MKLKPVIFLSGGLNLLLVILLISGSFQKGKHESDGGRWTPSGEPSNEVGSQPGVSVDNSEQVPEQATLPTFRWSQIESEDYSKYVKNLRSVGCPESTIRDIVEADLNQLFEPRYLEALAQVQGYDYWRDGMNSLKAQEKIRDALAEVDEERLGALRAVLGEDYVPGKAVASLSDRELLSRSKYGFLDGERQRAVETIQAKFDALDRDFRVVLTGAENRD